MNKLVRGLVLAAAMVTGSGSALAIDVRNEDQRTYKVEIKSSTMTREVELRALSMSLVVCVGECQFFVPGVGRTKARGNDTVAIRNGRIVTEVDKSEPRAETR